MAKIAGLELGRLIDPGLLLTLFLTLFAAMPLAMKPGMPNGTEVSLHSQRTAAIQQSGLFARGWLDGFTLAAGTPPSLLDGSLTYVVTGVFGAAFGLGAPEALRALVLICLLASSGGMFLFCRRRSGRLGAVLAGLIYAYSPALMYTLPYARGAFPELLALALFPLLLWRIDALRDSPTAVNFLLAFLLQVALVNTNSLMALLLTALAGGWIVFETLIQAFNREASQVRARGGALALLAILLGILASATAWGPVLLDSDWAPTEAVSETGQSAHRSGFTPLETLISPPPLNDAGAQNGLRELRILGLAPWILAVTGAVTALLTYIGGYRTRHPQAFLGTVYFAVMALMLVALTVQAAEGLWQKSAPTLALPGRLLGPIAALLAIVASMNGIWLCRLEKRFQISAIALLVALPIVTVIPLLYVPEWPNTPAIGAWRIEAIPTSQPVSDIAGIASASAIFLVSVIVWRLRRPRLTPRPYWTAAPLTRTGVIGVLLAGAIAALCLLITFREGVAWLRSPPGEALPAQVSRSYTLDGSLQLLGYDLNTDVFRPGDTILFNAYWYALERTSINYSSYLHLSAGGPPLAQVDKLHPGGRLVSEWGPEGYIFDDYELKLPDDLPAGEYSLIIGLYTCDLMPPGDCDKGYRPTLIDESGEVIGDSIVVSAIRVASP